MNVKQTALKPLFIAVGDNPARAFAMAADVRAKALAMKAGMEPGDARTRAAPRCWATCFAWTGVWARTIVARPGAARSRTAARCSFTCPPEVTRPRSWRRCGSGGRLKGGLKILDADTAEVRTHELRKRERPFVLPWWRGRKKGSSAAYDGL